MADVFGLQAMESYTVRHGLAIIDGKAGSGLSGKFEKSIRESYHKALHLGLEHSTGSKHITNPEDDCQGMCAR
jgi:hypothetical protein